MPTQKRRIQISLDPELDKVLIRLSDSLSKPISKILSDLLLESLPDLRQVADALDQAKAGKLDVDGFQKFIVKTHSKLDQMNDFLESHKQEQDDQ